MVSANGRLHRKQSGPPFLCCAYSDGREEPLLSIFLRRNECPV